MNEPIAKAIATVGSAVNLGKLLGISSQAIGQWKKIPAERVVAVERATGISRFELRPDLYAAPARKQTQRATTLPRAIPPPLRARPRGCDMGGE